MNIKPFFQKIVSIVIFLLFVYAIFWISSSFKPDTNPADLAIGSNTNSTIFFDLVTKLQDIQFDLSFVDSINPSNIQTITTFVPLPTSSSFGRSNPFVLGSGPLSTAQQQTIPDPVEEEEETEEEPVVEEVIEEESEEAVPPPPPAPSL